MSSLRKKEVIRFSAVTSDWRAVAGDAVVTNLGFGKSKGKLSFFITMKMKKGRPDKPSH
jgi:hypothetical protein